MAALCIEPRLPGKCPEMTVRNLLNHWVHMDVKVGKGFVEIKLKSPCRAEHPLKLPARAEDIVARDLLLRGVGDKPRKTNPL